MNTGGSRDHIDIGQPGQTESIRFPNFAEEYRQAYPREISHFMRLLQEEEGMQRFDADDTA